jgi:radical SAM protein with 4Fe4S-binding SPASM domain
VDDWHGVVKLPSYLKIHFLYPRFFRPCQFLIKHAVVFSNGNVGVCLCRDYNADSELILGNLRENSLKELLQGEKRFRLFSEWSKHNKIPKMCKKCRHYEY